MGVRARRCSRLNEWARLYGELVGSSDRGGVGIGPGTNQRRICSPRKNASNGTISQPSHGIQIDRIKNNTLPQSRAQPTRVIVPLKPTSSEMSGYSSELVRRRSRLR